MLACVLRPDMRATENLAGIEYDHVACNHQPVTSAMLVGGNYTFQYNACSVALCVSLAWMYIWRCDNMHGDEI